MLTGIEPVTTTLPTRGGILSCVIYQSSTLLSYRHLKNWRKMKGSNLRVTEQQCLSRTSLLPIQAIFRITNLETLTGFEPVTNLRLPHGYSTN